MWQQKSYKNDGGLLYLIPTPIGNLEDMSFRAVRILKEADIIAAEDTRNTKKLCNHFEITTPIVSYHEHNKEASGRKLIETLQSGKTVALVSDAGMPTIADPGYELVVAAVENRLPVVPLPGANAALTALIASGLPTHPFYFYGFLNRQKKEKKKELEALKYISGTVLLYESPHRLKETLQLIKDILGDRNISLCRELTKIYEEFIRGTIDEVIDWANTDEIRGEFCIVIEKGEAVEASEEQWWTSLSIVEHVNHYIEVDDLQAKEAIKRTAVDRSMPKREVYQEYHID
ncbi:16S rRNA (cytidine(1402)-2'-O)-methyltransferase [Niallia taxi]|uniref:16S rRNA (cytidine(1402)-2'-O)-methyltransferase n=1 Tax=Niallia taxi TaxID=2499688 RepID=UPI0012476684|nr:16S rRNA (cytidine(1402)-2'-O)-methyltransferase [Niallia taxi]MCM3218032.1 16S rRNA (cytidine(1402)-2'-O)-methyltransferase [Niallia taxi]MDK8643232.1 16S rRNA (cytidine(1402)-2'-O)-methyltransferase [Niallia taxi]MED4040174.1 16S rRNA (cytidine(1402)-2'-O)-methyltransferase [Niallia taxi]MED4056124.1 16S rRNA (cytidine(1402)-2'-O)-methyltransferase [Niallia taxi]MED4120566.1 16S rRNA (cytidine(1402)-2'-O)-methyltransferase [Niallia taxi]